MAEPAGRDTAFPVTSTAGAAAAPPACCFESAGEGEGVAAGAVDGLLCVAPGLSGNTFGFISDCEGGGVAS